MNKKIFVAVTGLCLALIVCGSVGWYFINKDNRTVEKYSLGKTPHSYQCTFGENLVLCKEYIFCGDEGARMPELINRRTEELENIKEGDYKNAISDDELDALLKTMTEYYQKKLSWEIIDYRIADNGHSLYPLYEDYELGNVIVFEVHTTNNPSGLYRAIALGRKNDNTEWEVLNEGV